MPLTTNASSLNMPAWDSRMSGALKPTGKASEDDIKLKKACQEMEAVFLNLLLKSMRATVPKSETGGAGMQADTMQSMFDMEMTRNMAAAGGTGIAAMMYRNLTRAAVAAPLATPAAAAPEVKK
jgi:flagellar protein FlgJ